MGTLVPALGAGERGRNVSLTFIVAHGFLCHQLDAASSHHIMELVQQQESMEAKGRRWGRPGGEEERKLGAQSQRCLR